jgi:hypothetical protein
MLPATQSDRPSDTARTYQTEHGTAHSICRLERSARGLVLRLIAAI